MRANLSKFTLLASLFILPLLGPYQGFGYEQTKILFFIVSITLIGLLWFGRGFRWSLISKIAGIFILILLGTAISGVNIQNSLLGSYPYFQGVILYAYLFLFYLMIKTFRIKLATYALVLSASALLVSFLAIKDWTLLNIFNQPISTYSGRVISSFGQPNFYAGFLLLILPFAYYLFKTSEKFKYFGLIVGLISIIGIFVSYSRSAALLALILFILGLIDQLKIKLRMVLMVFGIILASSLFALKFSSGFVGNEFAGPLLTNDPDLTKESVEKRVYIWPVAWKLVLQKPLFGYGLENISYAFANYFAVNKNSFFEANPNISPVLISLKEVNLDRTHNYLLDLLIFAGSLGLIGWVSLVMLVLIKIRQVSYGREQNVLLITLTVYLIWIQFQNQSIMHLTYFWLLLGLVDKNHT